MYRGCGFRFYPLPQIRPDTMSLPRNMPPEDRARLIQTVREVFHGYDDYPKRAQSQILSKWYSWYGEPHTGGTTDKQQNDLFWLLNEYHEREELDSEEFWQDARDAYSGSFSAAA